jgi:hypothetical protein
VRKLGFDPRAGNVEFVADNVGTQDGVVVEALCYKPSGRGFETR